MPEQVEDEVEPLNLKAETDDIHAAINSLGLTNTAVMLSEGFCPVCSKRGTSERMVDQEDDEDERNPNLIPVAEVNCANCRVRWRTGMNPENDLEWVEYGRVIRDGMVLTMTLNSPPEPPEEDSDWWDEDDEFSDDD